MKIRLDADLYERVQTCADNADPNVGEWLAIAINRGQKGWLKGVAVPKEMLFATREASVVATAPGVKCSQKNARLMIARAVLHTEAINAKHFAARAVPEDVARLTLGTDYKLG